MSAQAQERLETAANLGSLGLDPLKYLYTIDHFERAMMEKLAEKMQDVRKIQDENLAILIAQKVSKLFPK